MTIIVGAVPCACPVRNKKGEVFMWGIKNLGSIRLATVAKICIILTLILVFIGAGIGITRTVQARQEREKLNAINDSLDQQGLSLQTRNLILEFIGKYHQTQNIVVTDKDDNIAYSANKNIINGMTTFALEPDQNMLGVFDLKGSTIQFFANPKSEVPFIQKGEAGVQNSDNYFDGYKYNEELMPGSFGYAKNMRVMPNNFNNDFGYSARDRFDGPGKGGIRVIRIMGPGMIGAGFVNGIPDGRFGLDQNTLFLSSYKADAKGLNIYYISKGFEQNHLMAVLFITIILIKLLTMILFILLAVWVYRDSKARGLKPIFWGLITLFTGLIGFVIYLIFRYNMNFCHACKHKVGKDDNFCYECGAALKSKCQSCGENLKLDSNYCTKCGAKQEEK